ncbi:MAG: PH domain-containing protein [Chloracidobacterium sp.]|nr:PH domain-containing protein [Chloracidobacterium sp.]MDW8216291.1 PH domain-containing protein [Acidobacteriota bacterium]
MSTQPSSARAVVFRQTFLFVGLWYGLAVILAVVLAVLGGVLEAVVWTRLAPAVPFLTAALCLAPFIVAGVKHLQQWSETYTLTDDKIEVSTGILTKTVRNIPLTKVQDVTVEQTLLQRLLGLGNVVVDSAAATGKVTLRQVAQPQAIADQILHRAGTRLP